MDYQTAKDIRGRSLTSMITNKMIAGSGVFGGTRSALSQKMKARATGIKEKFDPMNVARFMTGGSKFATAAVGRMTGRSQRDIEYFTGKKKRTFTKIDKTSPPALNASSADVLNQMFDFFKRMDERDTKRTEIERSFREEKEIESERRHSEFISVLKNFLATEPGAPEQIKKEEGKGGGLFEAVGSVLSTMFNTFKTLISSITSLFKWLLKPILFAVKNILRMFFNGIVGLSKSLFGLFLKSLSWIPRLLPFFTRLLPLLARLSPLIAVLIALATEKTYKQRFQESPEMAQAVLEDPRELKWFETYHKLDEKFFRDIVDKAIAEGKLKPSTENRMDDYAPFFGGGETPVTKQQFIGTGNQAKINEQKWKLQFEPIYTDEGIRRDLVSAIESDYSSGLVRPDSKKQEENLRLFGRTETRVGRENFADRGLIVPSAQPITDPMYMGDILDQQSREIATQRRLRFLGTTGGEGQPSIIGRSNNVPLPDAPDPKAADTRNRTRIFQKTIEKNLAPL